MIENIKEELKKYFESETYLDDETGYTKDGRGVDWMIDNLLPKVERLIDKNLHKNCLDVGSSQGYFTRVLKEHFENAYGVDFSENRISYAKKYETDNLKFVVADLTESLSSKIPMKFDFMFTNAVIPHIPAQFKSDVFKNLAEIANPGCIFTIYDGMIPEGVDLTFNTWKPGQHINVAHFSKSWLEENATDWEIVEINNIGYLTEEIILKRK
jgi:2-polyprenyl-3-methyl-5-hydroxy-6-metoxy-1,4-benzoquinol methylase